MPDIERVIKGLEAIVNDDWMWKKADYYAGICKDTLALLKEQESVKTKHNNGITHWYMAAECDVTVNPGDKFCHECGRQLQWNG